MGIIYKEIKRYDSYMDEFIKNTTVSRIEIGTDGNLYRLSVSSGNEYLPKDELYTKADMMAMLEQLDLEIQEQIAFMGDCEETNGMKRANNLIKDKINDLKQSIWQDNYNGKKEKPKEVEQ